MNRQRLVDVHGYEVIVSALCSWSECTTLCWLRLQAQDRIDVRSFTRSGEGVPLFADVARGNVAGWWWVVTGLVLGQVDQTLRLEFVRARSGRRLECGCRERGDEDGAGETHLSCRRERPLSDQES